METSLRKHKESNRGLKREVSLLRERRDKIRAANTDNQNSNGAEVVSLRRQLEEERNNYRKLKEKF